MQELDLIMLNHNKTVITRKSIICCIFNEEDDIWNALL